MPNGPNANDADDTIDGASHEHREMIDDPYLNAWFDNKGYESSDTCAYVWGPTTSTATSQYNQTINGHHYLLQEEWSNATKSCVQRGVEPVSGRGLRPSPFSPRRSTRRRRRRSAPRPTVTA